MKMLISNLLWKKTNIPRKREKQRDIGEGEGDIK